MTASLTSLVLYVSRNFRRWTICNILSLDDTRTKRWYNGNHVTAPTQFDKPQRGRLLQS